MSFITGRTGTYCWYVGGGGVVGGGGKSTIVKGLFKGVQGVQTHPPEIFRFFWKSEGKGKGKGKRKKGCWGEGCYLLTYFWG